MMKRKDTTWNDARSSIAAVRRRKGGGRGGGGRRRKRRDPSWQSRPSDATRCDALVDPIRSSATAGRPSARRSAAVVGSRERWIRMPQQRTYETTIQTWCLTAAAAAEGEPAKIKQEEEGLKDFQLTEPILESLSNTAAAVRYASLCHIASSNNDASSSSSSFIDPQLKTTDRERKKERKSP